MLPTVFVAQYTYSVCVCELMCVTAVVISRFKGVGIFVGIFGRGGEDPFLWQVFISM